MDRNQLEVSLQPFREACLTKSRPLSDMCVFKAYPGDIFYFIYYSQLNDWVDEMDCSEAIDFLFDTLWETVWRRHTEKNLFY